MVGKGISFLFIVLELDEFVYESSLCLVKEASFIQEEYVVRNGINA
jgi:hypothetical protein